MICSFCSFHSQVDTTFLQLQALRGTIANFGQKHESAAQLQFLVHEEAFAGYKLMCHLYSSAVGASYTTALMPLYLPLEVLGLCFWPQKQVLQIADHVLNSLHAYMSSVSDSNQPNVKHSLSASFCILVCMCLSSKTTPL